MADIFARTRIIEGSTGEWTLNNLILGDGELALERHSLGPRVRVGDGLLPFLSAPILGADAENSKYNDTTIKVALDAHRIESMAALVAGTWLNIEEVQVIGFHAGWTVAAGPRGGSRWHFDGTTGGTPTGTSDSAIIAAMANGKVISADGKGWVISDSDAYFITQFGATAAANNSASLTSMLSLAASRRRPCVIDINSTLAGISIPSYATIFVRANVTHSSTSATMFEISNSDYVKIDFGKDQGVLVTRSGDERVLHIIGTSDYSNLNVEICNFRITGGTGTAIEWSACENITFKNGVIHDLDGTAIYSQSTLVTNPYRTRNASFSDCHFYGLAGSNTCHAISINSWVYAANVFISNCTVRDIKNNAFEIWANHVHCHHNVAVDCAISYSFGSCHYLNCHDNESNCTTPATSGNGAYGIEIGACTFFNVHHNIIRGNRNGVRMTGGAVNGGTAWFTTTEVYSEAGTLDPADTNKLRILSRDYAPGINLSGSYIGIISENVVLDCLNSGIYGVMDYYQTRAVKICGNLISRLGRYAAPTETLGAIACRTGRYYVSDNVIEDTLNAAIFNENSRVVLGANVVKVCSAATPYSLTGLGGSYNFLARQDLSGCTIAGAVAGATPTQGTWFAGDTLLNHTPAAAGSLGIVCTTPGTQSTQLNTRTATTTNGSTAVVLAANIGDAQIGVRVTIAGVTGIKTITDVNYGTNTITIDAAADASVAGAAVANSAATFKALPAIAA